MTLVCSKCGSSVQADKNRYQKHVGKPYLCRKCRKTDTKTGNTTEKSETEDVIKKVEQELTEFLVQEYPNLVEEKENPEDETEEEDTLDLELEEEYEDEIPFEEMGSVEDTKIPKRFPF